MTVRILVGDCLDSMEYLPDRSVHTCITSPPYFGLRDYGHDGQIGLEQTPDEFVAKLVEVFREVRRVLRDDGTLWLNLGDSYGAVGGNTYAGFNKRWSGTGGAGSKQDATLVGVTDRKISAGLKPKNLLGIPWRVAFALQADGAVDWRAVQTLQRVMDEVIDAYGDEPMPDRVRARLESLNTEWRQAKGNSWYLRQDIIWHKPNPMPESVRDRCTKAHEYVFLLSKKERYYFDAASIEEDAKWERWGNQTENKKHSGTAKHLGGKTLAELPIRDKKNRRSVWTVATKPFKGAHFATFPPDLIEPCVLAGCPVGGVVLDPFGGAGTTGLVAQRHGRSAILCELNPEYAEMARHRIEL